MKGFLTAREAAAALAAGFRAAGVEAVEVPLADGGEGTAEVLHGRGGGEWLTAEVSDPLGRPVDATFLMQEGRAVVESAQAIGLWRLRSDELDPLRATSRGLGELIRAAADAGANLIVVALGGSATVDGGSGMRDVLQELPVPVIALTDVRNPLLGPRGAARVFGPQKGATSGQVDELERRLAALAELRPVADLPGAGAAGGLGAALAALGAELRPGIDFVLEEIEFTGFLGGANLAVTGEGSVDLSSAEGKVPAGVAAACAHADVACAIFGGQVEPGAASALLALGATSVYALSGRPERARRDLAELGESLGYGLAAPGR